MTAAASVVICRTGDEDGKRYNALDGAAYMMEWRLKFGAIKFEGNSARNRPGDGMQEDQQLVVPDCQVPEQAPRVLTIGNE